MANTRFFLDTRNAKEGKPCVLKIAIAHKKKTAYISLDAKLVPSTQWDAEKEKVINHPDKLVLTTYINRVKNQIDSLIVRWTNDGEINSLSATEIKDRCMEELDPDRKKAKEDQTTLENPGADDPWGQVDLTPEAKIGLTPLPKIKMAPVDIEPAGDFICIFGFRFGRRGIKPKKHEYKVKKHSPVSRIGNGNKKHQQCF